MVEWYLYQGSWWWPGFWLDQREERVDEREVEEVEVEEDVEEVEEEQWVEEGDNKKQ